MIAQELEVSLHMAFMAARQKRHEFITVEHLLLAMLDTPSAAEALRACAGNNEELRQHLTDFIQRHTPTVAGTDEVDTQPTLGFQINSQKELNRKLMKVAGVPRESIVMDPTTAALAYGLDFAYSNMERIRLGALKGDEELTFPMSSGTTNAWGVRESWMVRSPNKDDSDWGDRMLRGPIWEILTGYSLAMAGVAIFMMMHPQAVAYVHEITQSLMGRIEAKTPDTAAWLKMGV